MRNLLSSGARFLAVGALSTVIEIGAFNLLVFGASRDAVVAKLLAAGLALISAYFGNREWAFRHRPRQRRGPEIGWFLAVNVVCAGLGAGIVYLGAAVLGTTPLLLNLVNLGSIVIVVGIRFVLYHHLVFRTPRPEIAS